MPQVSVGIKAAFGVGEFATATKGMAMNTFLLFYYTQVLGLEGALAGLALGIATVFDAINDPMVGSASDNWRSPLGRRHPFMWFSVVPMCISFWFLFAPIPGLSGYGLFAWLTVMAILARSAMTFFQIPHNAFGAELSSDYAERSRIMAYAQLFGWIGGAGFALVAYEWVFRPTEQFENGLLNPDAYVDLAWMGVAVIAFGILLSTAFTQRRGRTLPMGPPPEVTFSFRRTFGDARKALQNRNFRLLFIGILISGSLAGVGGVMGLHMQTYFWGLLPAQIKYFVIAGIAVNFVVFFVVQLIAGRFDKKKTLVALSAFAAIDSLTVISLRLVGWFPENGDPILLPLIVTTWTLAITAGSIGGVIFRSMIADIVDEQEVITGERQEGMFYSALAFSGKFVSGIGTMLGGVVLSIVRFPPNVDATGVPPDVLFRMGVFMGPILGTLYAIPLIIYSLYRLDKRRHAEIQAQLVVLRQQRAADATPPAETAIAAGD